jgi:hypothetical protein
MQKKHGEHKLQKHFIHPATAQCSGDVQHTGTFHTFQGHHKVQHLSTNSRKIHYPKQTKAPKTINK